MSLSEVELAYFFPAFLLLYWLVPRRASLQNLVLVAGGLFFYATWNLKLLPLFVASTLADYAILRGFASTPVPPDDAPEGERARAASRRRWLLAAGVAHNLGALFYFKYAGFFAESLQGALGVRLFTLKVALPLGISFYTMGRLGVLIDTYHERLAPVRSLGVWAAFVTFFPQLIAGPIGRGSELFDQYERPRRPDPAAFQRALGELATGFFFKVYVAAQVANELVDPVFAAPGTFTRRAHVLALVGYAAQVFADFAGYSLIAIGLARLLGVTLPENFNRPFSSQSPPEVWRRWHMTLNRWLFDYLYGPMVTGDGVMRDRIGLGFVVVMLISGLWHGAAWTYLLWGALHGLWLLAHHRYDVFYRSLCRKDRSWVTLRRGALYGAAGWLVTITFFVLTLVPFRATSLAACGKFARALVSGGDVAHSPGTAHAYFAILAVVLHHVFGLARFDHLRERVARAPVVVKGVTLGALVVFLFMFAPVGAGTFIYAQF